MWDGLDGRPCSADRLAGNPCAGRVGLLGLETSFAERRLHLGYRRARPAAEEFLFGHEFHYATVLTNPDACYADICDIEGERTPDQGATWRDHRGVLSRD